MILKPELLDNGMTLPEFASRPEVDAFQCGANEWETELSDYLKCAPGGDTIFSAMGKSGCEAWLFRDAADVLVGFAVLVREEWDLPAEPDPVPLVVLDALAIHSAFQGFKQPPGAPSFARQMMNHVKDRAARSAHNLSRPALGLFVDHRNTRGMGVYQHLGFTKLPGSDYRDERGRLYHRMSFNLSRQGR